MRKLLLGTSALIGATALVASASAAGPELTISGNLNFEWVGGERPWTDGQDQGAGESGWHFDQANSLSEIKFFAEGESDGGTTYGANIDYRYLNSSTDEAYIFVSGDWGTLHLGQDDGAVNQTRFYAGSIAPGGYLIDGNATYLPPRMLANPSGSFGAYSDNNKILYVSNDLSGFKFALSVEEAQGSSDLSGGVNNQHFADRVAALSATSDLRDELATARTALATAQTNHAAVFALSASGTASSLDGIEVTDTGTAANDITQARLTAYTDAAALPTTTDAEITARNTALAAARTALVDATSAAVSDQAASTAVHASTADAAAASVPDFGNVQYEDLYEIGLSYTAQFDGGSLGVSVGYATADVAATDAGGRDDVNDYEEYIVGIKGTFDAFSFAASYADAGESGLSDAAERAGAEAPKTTTYGIAYDIGGGMAVGLSYAEQETSTSAAVEVERNLTTIDFGFPIMEGMSGYAGIAVSEIDTGIPGATDPDATTYVIGTTVSF